MSTPTSKTAAPPASNTPAMPALADMATAPLAQHAERWVALYDRVSKVKPRDKARVNDAERARSTERQRKENRAAVAALFPGLPVVEYVDHEGASRFSDSKRPDWQRLKADVAAGRVAVIVVWEVSRLDRVMDTAVPFLTLCRVRGVVIHVTTDRTTYDPGVGAHRSSLLAEAQKAEAETEKLSERSRSDMRARAAAGKIQGKTPYGYVRRYDPASREFSSQTPEPTQAPVVRRIIRDLARGVPLIELARRLNAEGIPGPSGGEWHRTTIRKTALNPTYAGFRSHKGALYPATDWPALVTEAEHLDVVRVLTDPTRSHARPGANVYDLSGVVICPTCESLGIGPMRGYPARVARWKGRAPHATPARYKCQDGKSHAQMRAEWLDEWVAEWAAFEFSTPEIYDRIMSADRDAGAEEAAAEAKRLQAEINEALDSVGTPGGLSVSAAARVEARLAPLVADAQKRAQATSMAPLVAELLGAECSPMAVVKARWAAFSPAQRKAVLRALGARITVAPATVIGAKGEAAKAAARERVHLTGPWADKAESAVS